MPRSNAIIARQPSPPMKLPHQIHHPYQPPSPIHHHEPTSSASLSASLSHSTASDLHSFPETFIQHHSYQPINTQIHPFVKHEQISVPTPIPCSVKGAPTHMRPAIRKRQNSESAKRSRQRRKDAAKTFYRRFEEQCKRLASLEKKVATLFQQVQEDDENKAPMEPRLKQEDEILLESAPPHQEIILSDRLQQQLHSTAIEQNVEAISTPSYEDEQHGSRSHPNNLFEEELEALMETVIESNPLFGTS